MIKKHHIFCICNEIYSELTYDHPHTSIASFIPDQAIVFNGVSKTFAMTGYRIGLICGPAKVISKINGIYTIAVTTTTTCAQYAASEAFKSGYEDGPKMRKIYKQRCDILRDGLAKAGFTSPEPSGAFYIFAKIPSQFTQNIIKFATELAEKAHVGGLYLAVPLAPVMKVTLELVTPLVLITLRKPFSESRNLFKKISNF